MLAAKQKWVLDYITDLRDNKKVTEFINALFMEDGCHNGSYFHIYAIDLEEFREEMPDHLDAINEFDDFFQEKDVTEVIIHVWW